MAKAKTSELKSMYDKLDAPGGEKDIYRIAKARNKASKDFTHIKQIKNGQGLVLKDENGIRERWRDYFNTLFN